MPVYRVSNTGCAIFIGVCAKLILLVFSESLRIFPALTFSSKICSQKIELPNRNGSNITIDKGTICIVPHGCFMKDEDYFPNPEAFQPDRFMEPDAAKNYRERGVFMGFGDGPRICIGEFLDLY